MKIVSVMIMLMVVFFVSGCENKTTDDKAPMVKHSGGEIGKGAKSFEFIVVDVKGEKTVFTVNTDKNTVGEALVDAGLIAGDAGSYGLYVKTVNGDTLDYNKDKKYWAFYIDGEYAVSGVDKTTIEKGKTYTFKAE